MSQSQILYQVFDRQVTDRDIRKNGGRIHDLQFPDGKFKSVKFTSRDQAQALPPSLAIKLASIPGFEVLDDKGKPVVFNTTKEAKDVVLRDDQVIAELTELRQEALLARANNAGGGFKKMSKSTDLIQYLININRGVSIDPEEDVTEIDTGDDEESAA